MIFTVILEILVCMLAVFGIYAILCRLLAHGCYQGDTAIGLRLKDGGRADWAALADGVRRARLLTEGQRGKMLPPVILLTGAPSEALAEQLHALGGECEIYYKI